MNQGKISFVAIVVVSYVVVAALLFLPTISVTHYHHPYERCFFNLHNFALATKLYREDFRSYPPWRNPDFFTTLYKTRSITYIRDYRCPSSPEENASPEQFFANDPRVTDYECRNHPPDQKFSPALIMWEKKPFHKEGRNVVLGYFKREEIWRGGWKMEAQLLLPEEKFQELLKEARK